MDNDSNIMKVTEELIDKLYQVKNEDLFQKIKEVKVTVKYYLMLWKST